MFLVILFYPTTDYALVLLEIDAPTSQDAMSQGRLYALDQGWDAPSKIDVYGIPEKSGHIVTLHNFSFDERKRRERVHV